MRQGRRRETSHDVEHETRVSGNAIIISAEHRSRLATSPPVLPLLVLGRAAKWKQARADVSQPIHEASSNDRGGCRDEAGLRPGACWLSLQMVGEPGGFEKRRATELSAGRGCMEFLIPFFESVGPLCFFFLFPNPFF